MAQSIKDAMNMAACKSSLLKEMTEEERQKLQTVLTNMLSEIQDACSRANIEFAVAYGTVLGAIRHHGFIPWDDDIDLIMLRSEWEKFKCVFPKILGDRYVMEAPCYNNADSKTTWGKVYLKNTELIEIQELSMPFEKGIFIDVFIMDNVSDNRFVRRFDAFVSYWMKGIATSQLLYKFQNAKMDSYMRFDKHVKKYYQKRLLLGKLFSFVSHKRWCKWFDLFVSRHHKQTQNITVAMATSYEEELFDRNDILPFQKAVFNGLLVKVPNHVDVYLTKLYGKNYMQIPPVEKREKHFIVNLDFGKE